MNTDSWLYILFDILYPLLLLFDAPLSLDLNSESPFRSTELFIIHKHIERCVLFLPIWTTRSPHQYLWFWVITIQLVFVPCLSTPGALLWQWSTWLLSLLMYLCNQSHSKQWLSAFSSAWTPSCPLRLSAVDVTEEMTNRAGRQGWGIVPVWLRISEWPWNVTCHYLKGLRLSFAQREGKRNK